MQIANMDTERKQLEVDYHQQQKKAEAAAKIAQDQREEVRLNHDTSFFRFNFWLSILLLHETEQYRFICSDFGQGLNASLKACHMPGIFLPLCWMRKQDTQLRYD